MESNLIRAKVPAKYQKKVLCIARVSPQKKISLFLETALLLPEYAFIWIGNQRPVENTPENVFCLGNIPNAGKYNNDVDLFMLPSAYEGLPIVIIEAMKAGKPIVASNVGGISEIVINGENGFTVENEAAAFVDKIKYILEDAAVYTRFCERSRQIYTEKLTVEKMTREYLKIYQELCLSPKKGRD
jgi:glycosyltransferase involved in cell wall biosynthesis